MNRARETIVASLGRDDQLELVAQARVIIDSASLLSPSAGGLDMSVRVSNAGHLGWVADRRGYRYSSTHPISGSRWPPIPREWVELATRIAGEHPWDCAHLVWYSSEAKLGWHRDVTEAERHPIVTVSLGDDAVWAVREDDGEPIHRARLMSGDVTLLAGPTRMYLHTVERIEAPAPLLPASPLTKPGRLAISLRVAGAT